MIWLVSQSRATTPPVRQDMEMMLRMMGSGADHLWNVVEDTSPVNIETCWLCE